MRRLSLMLPPAGTPGRARARERARRGAAAEALAARLLERHGLSILARNHRCRVGEIDLVARDGDTLVFVEVRLRARDDYGDAAASLTARKLERVRRAALHFLARLPFTPPCRFDAVVFDGLDPPRGRWLRGILRVA